MFILNNIEFKVNREHYYTSVESNYVIAIATLSEPMRIKTKTSRTM